MPKTMRRHRAGSLARAVVRDACSSAFIRFIRLPLSIRSPLQNEYNVIILGSVLINSITPWCRASNFVSTRYRSRNRWAVTIGWAYTIQRSRGIVNETAIDVVVRPVLSLFVYAEYDFWIDFSYNVRLISSVRKHGSLLWNYIIE